MCEFNACNTMQLHFCNLGFGFYFYRRCRPLLTFGRSVINVVSGIRFFLYINSFSISIIHIYIYRYVYSISMYKRVHARGFIFQKCPSSIIKKSAFSICERAQNITHQHHHYMLVYTPCISIDQTPPSVNSCVFTMNAMNVI